MSGSHTSRGLPREALRTLARHPLRTGLLALGPLVGVAALTLVVWAGAAVEGRVLETVRRNLGAASVVVTTGGPVLVGGARDPGPRLTLDDAAALAAALPEVEAWDPLLSLERMPVRRGEASALARVVGASERAPRVWDRGAAAGAYFDAAQVQTSARVAVLGPATARALFGDEDPLGAEIQVGSVPFRVVGVLEPAGTDAHGNDRDAELAVPITTALRRLANDDTLSGVRLVLRDPGQAEAVAAEARRLLRDRHGLAPDRPDDFTVVTPAAIQRMLARFRAVFRTILPLLAAVALLAGGAVVASVTLLSVGARTGELALRRALGARPRDVALQILLETTATAGLGGLLGAALALGAAGLLERRLHLAAGGPWPVALAAVALAAAVGLAAGLLPAWRAARLHPADALRART